MPFPRLLRLQQKGREGPQGMITVRPVPTFSHDQSDSPGAAQLHVDGLRWSRRIDQSAIVKRLAVIVVNFESDGRLFTPANAIREADDRLESGGAGRHSVGHAAPRVRAKPVLVRHSAHTNG